MGIQPTKHALGSYSDGIVDIWTCFFPCPLINLSIYPLNGNIWKSNWSKQATYRNTTLPAGTKKHCRSHTSALSLKIQLPETTRPRQSPFFDGKPPSKHRWHGESMDSPPNFFSVSISLHWPVTSCQQSTVKSTKITRSVAEIWNHCKNIQRPSLSNFGETCP